MIYGHVLETELALSRQNQFKGLQNRSFLPKNSGMIFVYPRPKILSFWMKNTKIPLSIAFIDKNGIITQIEKLKPGSLKAAKSKVKCLYALEVNQDWFSNHGIKEGDHIQIPIELISKSLSL